MRYNKKKEKELIERLEYIKIAPYFIFGGLSLSFFLWYNMGISFDWKYVFINFFSNLILGIAIIARFLIRNKTWVLALYSFAAVTLYMIYHGMNLYERTGAIQMLLIAVVAWYIPQYIWRINILKEIKNKMNSEE